MSRLSTKRQVPKAGGVARHAAQANRPGRRERRHAETRERLMRCALRLFADRGFADTSIEDITEAADVGKGTFFNYFQTKEHVLDAFGKSRVAKVEAARDDVNAGRKSVLQAMRQLAHRAATDEPLTPKLMRSFLVAALLNDSVRRTMTGNQARGRRVLAEIVAIGQKRGEIRRDIPAQHVARAVQQEIFGAFLLWALDPELELSTWLDTSVNLVFLGIVGRGRDGGRGTAWKSGVRPRKMHSSA
jgi:AcrR family transcriptional regulator